MSEPDPQPATLPWLPLLGVAVAVAALLQLPLFGVDTYAFAHTWGPWAAKIPVFLAPLALAGIATDPRTTHSGGRALLVFSVLASGWVAWNQLAILSDPVAPGFVHSPGLGLRALVALTSTALHALLLFLAARLDGPRVHGLWWVVGVAWAVQWLPRTGETWLALAYERPMEAAVFACGLLPALLAGTAWALFDAEHRWIRSFADAFALALLPAALLGDGMRWTGGEWFGLLLVVLVLPGLGIAGLAVRQSQGIAPLRGIAVGLPGLTAVGGLLALGAISSPDALRRIVDPGPFFGTVQATLPLAAPDAGPGDVEVLQARLDALRIQGTVADRGEGRATLELWSVSSVDAVLEAVLPQQAFSLRAVVEPGHDEPVDAVLEDCSREPCQPMSLGAPQLDASHVANASVQFDDVGQPMVQIVFTPPGAQAFGDWTGDMVEKRIAIVLDEQVMSAPVVREAITGGVAVISMGVHSPDTLAEARALAAALSEAPLQGHWTVDDAGRP